MASEDVYRTASPQPFHETRINKGRDAILKTVFSGLLMHNEARGRHASGLAVIDRDGEYQLCKRPIPATQLVAQPEFASVLGALEGRFSRAADWIGTANGTIYNADYLFRRFKLRRFAQVDSELLFRLAARAARSGQMDVEWFKERLRRCRGQMTAVLASRHDPETILLLKGNKPLELRIHRRYRVAIYASDPAFLDAVLADERGWRELSVPSMSMIVFRHEDLMEFSMESLKFIAQEKRGKAP